MLRLSFAKFSDRIFLIRSNMSFSTSTDIYRVLNEHFGIDLNTVESIIAETSKDRFLKEPDSKFIRNCMLCKKYKVELTPTKKVLSCLNVHPPTLEHRILLLQELGARNINVEHIISLPKNMSRLLKKFMKFYNIPSNENIIKNMLNTLGVRPCDINLLGDLSMPNQDTRHYYNLCMEYHKKWNLKLSDKALEFQNIQFQSFRMLNEVMDFLLNEIQFDKKFVIEHSYLLDISPDWARLIFTDFRDTKIAGKDIMEIVKKWPRILLCDSDNMMKVYKIIKEYDIPEHSILTNLAIFRIDYKLLLQRLEMINKNPDLSIWLKHPRVLYIIRNLNLVEKRLRVLYVSGGLKTANVHTISSVKDFFERYLKNETTHTAHKKYVRYVFDKELGNCSETLLRYIARHPFWRYVELTTIEKVLQYLKQHYSAEDICQNIHIVLYPQEVIQKTLETLHEIYSSEKGYNFTPAQYLALCLYMLEKDNHFSGDGVWDVTYLDNSVPNTS